MEQNQNSYSRPQIVTALAKSPHGKLQEYVEVGRAAAEHDPEFFAHLIAWNTLNGQIRDSKVALPAIFLSTGNQHQALVENALANLMMLDPRNLVRAFRFVKELGGKGNTRKFRRAVERYLNARTSNRDWFDRVALQHRSSMKELVAISHANLNQRSRAVLFGENKTDSGKTALSLPPGSVFEKVRLLPTMSAEEAAGVVIQNRIPFLITQGALGSRLKKDTSILMAMIGQMTPTELTTNMKMLEKLGVKSDPALRAALTEKLKEAATSKKTTLKATVAAEAVDDEQLRARLLELQEKQIQSVKGIDGNWLVLADCSPSMKMAIEGSRHIAGALAKFVKGNVLLVFFDGDIHKALNVTGKSYEEIRALTEHVTAGGNGTSIGVGLLYAISKQFEFDGIAIASDAQENTPPFFVDQYAALTKSLGRQVPVYLYRFQGSMAGYRDRDLEQAMRYAGYTIDTFNLRGQTVDYYSIPNLVQTMRANRYSLVDEIMETPLLTLDEVFNVNQSPKDKRAIANLNKEERNVTV